MSKISRIRILNLNYNNNTIKIDDETFDLGGQNTLISLRNGGGKSVLVQMIVSLFVNRTYRDFGDRPFKSYFTTNRPTFLMTEWILDNGIDRFLAGMMVRKNQKEDNDTEELEMYTFTGSYSNGCKYDLDNLPIIRQDGNKKILKGFGECKNLLEEISRNEPGDFRLYDMASQYGRRQYFSTLRQYQINNKEWESIIRKVNQKESGLSELFQNAKDEKDLVENWFLRPIEDKLNQEKNKIDEFRKLAFQFIEQYRSNQSKILRKGIIEQYFEDTKPLKDMIDDYAQKDRDAVNLPTMKSLDAKKGEGKAEKAVENAAVAEEKVAEKIDFSNVKIEPLFEEMIDFDTFAKADFRAVKILECEAVPKSKKLLKFTLDDGTDRKRTILSGIHEYYEPEDLIGKTAIAIVNLPPRKMMGIDSEGMLISAVHEEDGHEGLNLLMVNDRIPAGAKLY